MHLKPEFSIDQIEIHVEDIQVPVFLGHFEWERQKKQNIRVDLHLQIDVSTKIHSDQLKDTIDYDHVVQKIFQTCENQSFFLIEKVAHTIIKKLFENPKILSAQVSVKKNHPLPQCKAVCATVVAQN